MGFVTMYSFLGPINSFAKLNFDEANHFIYLKKKKKPSKERAPQGAPSSLTFTVFLSNRPYSQLGNIVISKLPRPRAEGI